MSDQYVPAGFDAQDEMFLSPHSYTALPTLCRHTRHTHRIFMRCIGLAVVLLATLPGAIHADEFIPFSGPPPGFSHVAQKKSLIEARTGYLWGINEIRFRDGDNAIIAPGKMELNVNGVIFGLQGETFASKDLAVRAQAWINIPQALRSDFLLDRTRRSWDIRAQFFEADLSIIYHLLPGGTPYTAGLTAGYRFDNFDYKSASVAIPGGSFNNHLHVHIPYLGIYYAHGSFVGSVVRLDVLASPFTISRLDATQDLAGSITQIDGQSLTGWWFESFFGWSRPVGSSAFVGAFAKYNYLGLSGGATIERDNASTRFSMDSWHNLFSAGLTATFTF
jgi:hypothetical protein